MHSTTTRTDNGPNALELALLWGDSLLAVEHFVTPTILYIGETKRADPFFVPAEALGIDEHALVVPAGAGFALDLGPLGIGGKVKLDDEVWTVDELREDGMLQAGRFLVVRHGVTARIEVGPVTLLVSFGPTPVMPRTPLWRRFDYKSGLALALSAMVHLALVAIMNLIPEEQLVAKRDPHRQVQKVFVTIAKASIPPETPTPEEPEEPTAHQAKPTPTATSDQATPTPKTPAPLTSSLTIQPKISKAPKDAVEHGAAQALQQSDLIAALDSGAANTWGAPGSGMQVIGSVGKAGGDLFSPSGMLDPFGDGLTKGTSGFRTSATSLGPGTHPDKWDGLAKPSATTGVVVSFTKTKGEPTLTDDKEKVAVDGDLPKSLIRKHVKRQLKSIKWCYQKVLQLDPKAHGKVTVVFTISPLGKVLKPKVVGNTLSSGAIEGCITKKIARWSFPSPKNGGIVRVTYPFVFKTN